MLVGSLSWCLRGVLSPMAGNGVPILCSESVPSVILSSKCDEAYMGRSGRSCIAAAPF